MKWGVWTNKYRLWDHMLNITWLHILQARNNIFPLSLLPDNKCGWSIGTSCLEVQNQASGNSIYTWRCSGKTMCHSLVLCPINTYNSFFQFCSRHRWLLCDYYLIFLPHHVSFNPRMSEPDCHPYTRSDTWKLDCLYQRKFLNCVANLHCITRVE